ncbi:putative glutathione S-transferase, C-terminal domain [Lyophyllum shimeji]|uniref:Glutathione S-transferase, C-terminal domain n=1 Tax=Lyophyllum shimeji TaxID=47721 RepID=A0A9P3PE08_LYOSH|nr:putative glutathione S-transferase, C-terminal domain [Lyophyllum shimeji]
MSKISPQLTLYTNHLTPNGLKVSIYLEELRAKDPSLDYKIERLDLSKGTQKEPWFIKLNPNGRIPVLIDHTRDDFPVFESAAILLYLEQNFDPKKAFSFDAAKFPKEYSSMLQWIFFAHGGLGPMQGQAHFFLHYALEDVPYGKKRYQEETKRLYGVLNIGLADRDYLAGPGRGRFTIADTNAFPWIRLHTRAGIETLDEWPNLKAWLSRVSNRPGVKAAIQSVAL